MSQGSIAGPPNTTSRPSGSRCDAGASLQDLHEHLHQLADCLACRVTGVAMESTGVYWISLYEILEARGMDVVLVNARHVKTSGRIEFIMSPGVTKGTTAW